MIRALVVASLFAACAPRSVSIPPDHPANPDAQPGRSAGAPAALRPGVATLEDPAPTPSEATPAATPVDHSQHGPQGEPGKAPPAKVDTIEDTSKEPKRVDPEKADPQKVTPPKKPAPKKPAPKTPPKQPAKPAEPPKEPPKPPMDHSGHGGHPS